MTRKHLAECDRCGAEAKLERNSYAYAKSGGYNLPIGWAHVEVNRNGVEFDLCPDCVRNAKSPPARAA